MLYPIGIQNFEKIITGGYVYVDKTAQIYDLASTGQYYFLSRPRRFGKSLLVSTMEAYFSGRKELFRGLAMEGLEKEWRKYPVLHLDLTGSKYTEVEDLRANLNQHLRIWENLYGIENLPDDDLPVRFKTVIDAAYHKTGEKVVILIDEYEKPIVDNIDDESLMEKFRRELQGFYSVIKGRDASIRFAFLTGVTKLGKMSIFSGLNNLNDISMDLSSSDICGISEAELRSYFDGSVGELAAAKGIGKEECYAKLKSLYDGYHFHFKASGIYNPFSLLNTFKSEEFRMYWFETGTPTFLVRYLKKGNYNLDNISKDDVPVETLTGTNYVSPAPITLMYQTGYLTIKGYDERFQTYYLDYPNEEVKSGFLNSLSQLFAPALISGEFSVYRFIRDIEKGDVADYVYVIELKRDLDPQTALSQIEEKGYDKPFLASGKQIIKLGINFSSETHTVDGWAQA